MWRQVSREGWPGEPGQAKAQGFEALLWEGSSWGGPAFSPGQWKAPPSVCSVLLPLGFCCVSSLKSALKPQEPFPDEPLPKIPYSHPLCIYKTRAWFLSVARESCKSRHGLGSSYTASPRRGHIGKDFVATPTSLSLNL